ncbi:MAG TPA: CHRD domain-containing protein [Vicinamibacterales bacterium]|nr:CHRD domain-containing protein [Vicinamibacterales bacterium]
MRKHFISAAIAAAVALGAGAMAFASDDDSGSRRARARLTGFQENPSISTTGTGTLDLVIDEKLETIKYELTYGGLEGIAPFVTDGTVLFSHIHVAARGVNGGVSVFLCGGGGKPACPVPSGTVSGEIVPADVVGPAGQGINAGEETAFAELVRAIRAGYTYVNVHTTRWPGGEIRGQIR